MIGCERESLLIHNNKRQISEAAGVCRCGCARTRHDSINQAGVLNIWMLFLAGNRNHQSSHGGDRTSRSRKQ